MEGLSFIDSGEISDLHIAPDELGYYDLMVQGPDIRQPKVDAPATALEEGLQKDIIELGLVMLEAAAVFISPVELPYSDLTEDPAFKKARADVEHVRIIQGLDFAPHDHQLSVDDPVAVLDAIGRPDQQNPS